MGGRTLLQIINPECDEQRPLIALEALMSAAEQRAGGQLWSLGSSGRFNGRSSGHPSAALGGDLIG